MGFYQPLFSVSVKHMYFSDGLWKGLDFSPIPGTMKVLDGAGMVFRQTRNGISVFFDDAKTEALRLYARDADGTLRFSFKVWARDRSFANYTAASGGKENAILCFSNRGASGEVEVGKASLSKGEFVSEDDFEEISALVAENVLDPADRSMPPDFVVSIFIEAEKAGGLSPQDFSISFDARQSYWKYSLLGKMNRAQPYIVDLDNRVEFEFCGEAMVAGRRPAKVFLSKEMIPVLERSSYRFQLREPGEGTAKILIKRLPVASEGRLGMEVINGKRVVVAESFVNY